MIPSFLLASNLKHMRNDSCFNFEAIQKARVMLLTVL